MQELASLLPLVAIGLLFWLLLIRPQSRRQRDVRQMQAALNVGDHVMLRVEDDGAGLRSDSRPGHGLTNMGERAVRLGGAFDVSPRPGGGTIVEWRVPFDGTADRAP